MKFTLILILLCCSTAGAAKLTRAQALAGQKRIAAACEKNLQDKKADRKKVCACVARNFTLLALKEKTAADAAGLLEYVEKHYALTLSAQEIEKDPYFIDEFLLDVGRGCLRDPKYPAGRKKN